MLSFVISDVNDGRCHVTLKAANGHSALEKCCAGHLSFGFYEIIEKKGSQYCSAALGAAAGLYPRMHEARSQGKEKAVSIPI